MIKWINPKLIKHNPNNPRKSFVNWDIRRSMQSEGYKEEFPLVIRPVKDKKIKYELVEGDCRLDSALSVGIPEVPYILRNLDDKTAFIEAIKENILRENFEPMEEVKALLKLRNDFGMNNVKIAETICKTEAYVRNTFDLLRLNPEIQKLIGKPYEKGKIAKRKAEYISEIENSDVQKLLTIKVLTENVSQKEVKRLVDRLKKVKNIKQMEKLIEVKKDHLSMLADKFKGSDLFEKIKKEKKEKGDEKQIASADFERYMDDLASWSSMLVGSAIELSTSLNKYNLKELYKMSKEKKTLRNHIRDALKNKEKILKFYNSQFYNRLKKVI